jgi:hypothetical protein
MSMETVQHEGIAGIINCTIHGPMHWRPGPDWWECLGFDGEGCGTQIFYLEDAHRCLRSRTWPPGIVVKWNPDGGQAGPAALSDS